ncbi:rhodanese-like domain-containing protein [Tropicimonas sediminicola]|uniref:Rhodanese-related sulfurtransferase n=1 Tax=Tropicimonas sediminicola TaxID=1031541 RepID=A0A239I5B2_9RHOB|nr:rhodanese-like domain-containing protein [Tropicimonas sediminicola]SNS89066.1 Rhodanese-related sulfurtransferase [Tropicimonas sediminicola]
MRFSWTFPAALLVLLPGAAIAEDARNVPAKKQTKAGLYLTAVEAAEMLKDESVVLLDVRSRSELTFVGVPTRVNVHIPLMVMPEHASYNPDKQSYALESNAAFEFDFLDYAEAIELEDERPIILICRSGSRSAKAADMIYDLGFSNVYTVIDGFEGDKASDGPERGHRVLNGWKNAGLGWGYEITPEQAYPGDQM